MAIKWTEYYIKRLGVDLDKTIAQAMGCSIATVCQKRIQLGIAPRRKIRVLSESEIRILRDHKKQDAAELLGIPLQSVDAERLFYGIRRTIMLRDYPFWEDVKSLSQSDFFKLIAENHKIRTGLVLTYPVLSSYCFWSVSRLQKWFTDGSAQEPMQFGVRHHIFLSVIFAISELETKIKYGKRLAKKHSKQNT